MRTMEAALRRRTTTTAATAAETAKPTAAATMPPITGRDRLEPAVPWALEAAAGEDAGEATSVNVSWAEGVGEGERTLDAGERPGEDAGASTGTSWRAALLLESVEAVPESGLGGVAGSGAGEGRGDGG